MINVDFRRIKANGLNHRVAVKGSGPLVLLVHGFPESWYSWRHQIDAIADAGFTVAVPDVRGYAGTDKPYEVEAYTLEHISADMAGLVQALSPESPAVVIGHDWGAAIAWHAALLHPEQFRAVAGLSVPYTPPGEIPEIDVYKSIFTDNGLFFYQVYFQDEGVAEAEFEVDIARTLRLSYYEGSGDDRDKQPQPPKLHGDVMLTGIDEPPMPLPWLTEQDLAYYASEFAASGFRGPINRYRNHRADHAFLSTLTDHTIYQPSLYIGGTRDLVYEGTKMRYGVADVLDVLEPNLPNLQGYHILKDCGHWTQQERPEEVNEILLDWLKKL